MTEYNLNILSFHYSFESDNKKITIGERINIVEKTLDENKDKKIDIVMCSEFYLSNSLKENSCITLTTTELIYNIFKKISAKFSKILFLPGTYYIYDETNKCYDNILPIFYGGVLIKTYKKFSVPNNYVNGPTPLCPQYFKVENPDMSNNILEINGKTFVLGICSDYSCEYENIIKAIDKLKTPIGLFVSYGIGSIFGKKIPIILVDGLNSEKYNTVICSNKSNCNFVIDSISIKETSFFNKETSHLNKKTSFLKVKYIKFNMEEDKKKIFFTTGPIQNILKETDSVFSQLKNNVITNDINKYITKVKNMLQLFKEYTEYYNSLDKSKITDRIENNMMWGKKLVEETSQSIILYDEILNKTIKQKYLKYKIKYLKLKN